MNRKHASLIAAGAATTVLLPLARVLPLGQAGATSGSGVSSSIVARGTTDRDIRLRAKQPTDLVFGRVTLQSGGSTGWHTHPGAVLAVVQSGTLTRYDRDCHAQNYTANAAFKEIPGVHMGANNTSETVVLEVTYIVPAGGPLSNDAPAPKCAAGL
jgi:quercetin dioxygenase-like cupin family protein